MHILTDKWEAVGSVVRIVYNDEDGGHFFVYDCHRRRDGVAEFNTVNAQDVAELAWCSLDANAKIYKRNPLSHGDYHGKINPCQKPVSLYKWLLQNYAKQGDKILDTHGGSCSLAIACHDMGFDLDACEIDKDYYRDAVERYERHAAQTQLFNGDLGYTYTNGAENAQQAELPIEEQTNERQTNHIKPRNKPTHGTMLNRA